jgi:IS5 family transposase
LLRIARTTLAQAQQVLPVVQRDPTPAAQRVAKQLTELIPLVQRAMEQTEQRILQERNVAAPDKVVSLCEPHTQILRRGKAQPHETEFGHKVNYAEVEHGFISDWQVIEQGNPSDADLLPPVLHQHRKRFGHAPHLLAVDRGAFSPANEALARRMRIKHIVLPKPGYRDGHRKRREEQAWFKRGQRFRNGIEGRISVVKRTMQLARCPCHGFDRFEQWIGWGVLTANLVTMARLYRKRHRRKRSC